jgi:hypothetical protein
MRALAVRHAVLTVAATLLLAGCTGTAVPSATTARPPAETAGASGACPALTVADVKAVTDDMLKQLLATALAHA